MEKILQNYTLPVPVQERLDIETKGATAFSLMPVLTAALQLAVTQILMSPDVSRTLPHWIARIFIPLSTIGVISSFVASFTATIFTNFLARLPSATKRLIIHDPTSLPARNLLDNEVIPLRLLDPDNSAELLQEFGFTAWTGYSLLAIICLFISAGIFFLTLCVLLYHNAVKTPWQQKKTKLRDEMTVLLQARYSRDPYYS
ncbi:hypothetical protein M408DRAFT_321152 [Serendipita vermifera MAFF 305830]|uniref:Uncharacterized protein n=1 Tax=Serendipita vermifera MAFF 305830 TaxID=933852 RepID=A0A0C3ATG4_SERVB|nr:hypothetical protein M408DRAFT_321152 [Serendipita vermifera MAFF 305830]